MHNPLAPTNVTDPPLLQPALFCLADTQETPLQWLWPGRNAIGKLNLLVGPSGLGKSCIALDIAARVSAGLPWPDDPSASQPPGGVLLVTDEATLADTAIPRLKAAAADLGRIKALTSLNPDPLAPCPIRLRDLSRLEQAIQNTPDCRLLVIDPILRSGPDSVTVGQIGCSINVPQLCRLAAKHHLALLAVAPVTTAVSAQAVRTAANGLPSNALAATIWALTPDNRQTDRRLFISLKSTLTHNSPALAYRITTAEKSPHIPHILWDEEPADISLEDALDARDSFAERRDNSNWLESLLCNGPVPASNVLYQAECDGVTLRAARNALAAIGGVRYRKGFGTDGQWLWALNAEQAEEEQTSSNQAEHETIDPKDCIDYEDDLRQQNIEMDQWFAEEMRREYGAYDDDDF